MPIVGYPRPWSWEIRAIARCDRIRDVLCDLFRLSECEEAEEILDRAIDRNEEQHDRYERIVMGVPQLAEEYHRALGRCRRPHLYEQHAIAAGAEALSDREYYEKYYKDAGVAK